MAQSEPATPDERARKRASEFSHLMWHVATFVIINAFLWILDIIGGDGVQWGFWVTVPWGIGAAFRAAYYYIDASGMKERRYRRYLEDEQRRETA